jgi:hypothetical protein
MTRSEPLPRIRASMSIGEKQLCQYLVNGLRSLLLSSGCSIQNSLSSS